MALLKECNTCIPAHSINMPLLTECERFDSSDDFWVSISEKRKAQNTKNKVQNRAFGQSDLSSVECASNFLAIEKEHAMRAHSSVDGPIAQSVEQLAFNQWVAGSSPARLTKS